MLHVLQHVGVVHTQEPTAAREKGQAEVLSCVRLEKKEEGKAYG